MLTKVRIVWSCIVGIGGLLAWFGIFSWPHDSAAAMSWINAIDQALFRPAAHPTMFALVVGVALGTIVIPGVWRVVRDHVFVPDPRPDWDLREAIDYLLSRSKWALGRVYFDTTRDRLLEEDIYESICDAIVQGRVSLWGRSVPEGVDTLFSRGTERKILSLDLDGNSLDLTTLDSTAPNGAVLRRYSQDQFRFLRVNEREVRREWPPASRIRLLFDSTWKSRRKRIALDVVKARQSV
jgi:hypothetical protein